MPSSTEPVILLPRESSPDSRLFLRYEKSSRLEGCLRLAPLRFDGGDCFCRGVLTGRGDADEIAVAHDFHSGHRLGGAGIERREFRTERSWAKDFAVEQSVGAEIGRVLMAAGDEIARVNFRNRFAGDGPVGRRRDWICVGQIFRQQFSSG